MDASSHVVPRHGGISFLKGTALMPVIYIMHVQVDAGTNWGKLSNFSTVKISHRVSKEHVTVF